MKDKSKKSITPRMVFNLLLAAMVCTGLFWACEDDANTDITGLDTFFSDNPYITDPRTTDRAVITVEPDSINVSHIGQTFALKAKGGTQPYTWSVTDASRGSITKTSSQISEYKALKVEKNNIIVNDKWGYAAIVEVLLGDIDALSISPVSVTFTDMAGGETANFKALGGTAPYAWTVSIDGLGTISGAGLYTVTGAAVGLNTITLVDANGKKATAQVVHETTPAAPTPALVITPGNTTISTNSTAQIQFVASGGVPPYGAWNNSITALGNIGAGTGLYTCNSINFTGTDTITITDSAGTLATATVNRN